MFTEALTSPATDVAHRGGLLCEIINRMMAVDRSAMRIAPQRKLISLSAISIPNKYPLDFAVY
jgi:hypothetical protein